MSKTVTGYIDIPGISYSEMVKEAHIVIETFQLLQEFIKAEISRGKTMFYDGTEVSGIVIKKPGGRIYDQIVITEKGLVYDDMIDKMFLNQVRDVLVSVVPGHFALEKKIKKIKDKIKKLSKSYSEGKIKVEVEIV